MNKEEIQKRLEAIGAQNLSALSDEAALALLEERKKLQAEITALEEAEQEEASLAAQKQALQEKLSALNASIKADLSDEELLSIVAERKNIETEIRNMTSSEPESSPAVQTPVPSVPAAEPEEAEPTVPIEKEASPKPEPSPEPSDTVIIKESGPEKEADRPTEKIGADEVHGSESVGFSLDPEEYQGYLRDLQANINDLGAFLQSLPAQARQSKEFMLEVAKIDPAYAMHYADKQTLAKDEYFNIQVAGMQNNRDTGNPLSEMLPEMRTEKVVLAGVKQDYRNVRFVRPEMSNYEEIISIAKKGALEAVAALKESHDVRLLVPAVLQKDQAFMQEVASRAKQNGKAE